ncbi:hypothetical protein Gotri_004695 [Gossypium trilobum]|uniref:Uncharacterized protein n=1 Tax=Gossypium trilobum TaxID=34281 RepID=A0A7J9F5P3_9ROSI|nr:hypothetical protein [Gossypium trilobum]
MDRSTPPQSVYVGASITLVKVGVLEKLIWFGHIHCPIRGAKEKWEDLVSESTNCLCPIAYG